MTWWFILFFLAITATLFFSVLTYLQAPITTKKRVFLISLRFLLIVLIVIAFLEPVIRFQRLPSSDAPVPVLIDASSSMNLFEPESTVLPLLRKLNAVDSRKFEFFVFGDSLRKLERLSDLRFSDKLSYFPAAVNSRALKNVQDIILFSDGNWSNTSLSSESFFEKTVHFISLTDFKHHSFLNVTVPQSQTLSVDSQAIIPLNLEIRSLRAGEVSISILESTKSIYNKFIKVDTGYTKLKLNASLPRPVPGKHLYKIRVYFPPDTLQSVQHSVYYALPGAFSYINGSTSPSLDGRFIGLSLKKRADFKEVTSNQKADLLLFFDWNSETSSKMQHLKTNGIAVFSGCLPCSTTIIPWHSESTFLRNKNSTGLPLEKLHIEDLPPPSGTIKKCGHYKSFQSLLSAVLFNENRKKDTVSVIFSAQWQHRKIIALTARDFWRWDFWPMSLLRSEEQAYGFTDLFIGTIKERLQEQLSDQFFIYPYKNHNESDSLMFALSFPSVIPVSSTVKLSFSLFDLSGNRISESIIDITNTGSSNQKLILPKIKTGSYFYKCKAVAGPETFSSEDTLYVEPDMSEFMITGQNLLFLREIGREANLSDSTAISGFIQSKLSGNTTSTLENFKLNRSWWLLGAIFLLFAIEWISRRVLLLD